MFRWLVASSSISCTEMIFGLFDRDLQYTCDWDMWLRIELAGYRVSYAAQPLACIRLGTGHETSVTARALKNNPSWIMYQEHKLIQKIFSRHHEHDDIKRVALKSIAVARVSSGLYDALLELRAPRA